VVIVPHPNHSNHNGGQLQFGPDGALFAGTGDGGGEGDSRTMLRSELAPRKRCGSILLGAVGIYSIGLRNPIVSFDLTTDRRTRESRSANVGQDRFEEIDTSTVAAANGANFGWNDFEGFAPFAGAHLLRESDGEADQRLQQLRAACSVIGGYVVRDQRLPALLHRYVYGDFCTGKVRSLIPIRRCPPRQGTGVRVRDLAHSARAPAAALRHLAGRTVYRFVRRRLSRMPKVKPPPIETLVAALVAVGAGIVGIANREAARELGAKFRDLERRPGEDPVS